MPIPRPEGIQERRRSLRFAVEPDRTSRPASEKKSTGVNGEGGEPIGDALGELVKGPAFSAGMAADLAMVEDHGKGIGQEPDHGQHYQGCGLVDSRVFEMTVGGDGLKNFCIDSPAAAAELMDEQR